MLVLDTDHLSLLQHADSEVAQRLANRLADAGERVATTVVTYEEQTRGWFAYLARSSAISHQLEAYRRLKLHLDAYAETPVLPFDEMAAAEYLRLQRSKVRIGAFDLKIAAIVLSRSATLLSRNLADFRRVRGLKVEDWSA
jgi:tRNA(fMet)-specific endonuclease VapC